MDPSVDTAQTSPYDFLPPVVRFENGSDFERQQPITDFRRDPGEARILFICRSVGSHASDGEPCIMKIKAQVPPRPASDDSTEPTSGPSSTTVAELKALQTFRDYGTEGVPHLLHHKCEPQGPDGPFPGGYISYTIMTKMPGRDLMASRFWSLSDEEKETRRDAFLKVFKNIWRVGIAPYDCALRNVLWDDETKRCSIVDFEHYSEAPDPINMNETQELQRWGLKHRPPPSHWAVEWGLIKEPNAR